ncbi:MAG: tetratricopeptide repeat protein [Candidatus Heimdallarchaeota archaeon]
MVLPTAFKTHESRLSQESLDAIEFQFDRLALDSKDPKVFFKRFLRISKSPTLPEDDHELRYLAAKIAYMLADYAYLNEFAKEIQTNAGAKVWFALAEAQQGEISNAIELLEQVEKEISETSDPMVYIECLGALAQILFRRGYKNKENLKTVVEKIHSFQEKNASLPDFDHFFLLAYLVLSHVKAAEIVTLALIEETKKLYQLTKQLEEPYFMTQFLLDLIHYSIVQKNFQELELLFEEVSVIFQSFNFKALKAKAICLRGDWEAALGDYEHAEKNYLEARKTYVALKDQIGVVNCIKNLAFVSESQQQFTKAEEYFFELLEQATNLTDDYNKVIALTNIAKLLARKGKYAEALTNYQTALEIAQNHSFTILLTPIFDGLSYVNFIAGNFKEAVETRTNALEFKVKYHAPPEELLMDHIKLGQLNAIVGNLTTAFDEFEKALHICTKLNKKDEIYFDILNWLFEISTALGKFSLAESYINRADLFASIHANQEENAQAIISRIRFQIQKKELLKAEKLLSNMYEQVQDFPSALTPALVLIEKTTVLLLKYLLQEDQTILEEVMQNLDDMLFISLDLEFLPLTMYTKKVLAKILLYKDNFKEASEELTEAIDLAKDLGMETFEQTIQTDLIEIQKIQEKQPTLSEDALKLQKQALLEEAISFLRETFWLVSASEHQRDQFLRLSS